LLLLLLFLLLGLLMLLLLMLLLGLLMLLMLLLLLMRRRLLLLLLRVVRSPVAVCVRTAGAGRRMLVALVHQSRAVQRSVQDRCCSLMGVGRNEVGVYL
jgi:hypothetical protein